MLRKSVRDKRASWYKVLCLGCPACSSRNDVRACSDRACVLLLWPRLRIDANTKSHPILPLPPQLPSAFYSTTLGSAIFRPSTAWNPSLAGTCAPDTPLPTAMSAKASGADPRSNGDAKSRAHHDGSTGRAYTVEQKAAVIRIKRCSPTAFYEILGLEEVKATCSEGEIKKAYRKLSLLTHPDKNGYDGADEAFKCTLSMD